jgi:hypothetical protein
MRAHESSTGSVVDSGPFGNHNLGFPRQPQFQSFVLTDDQGNVWCVCLFHSLR